MTGQARDKEQQQQYLQTNSTVIHEGSSSSSNTGKLLLEGYSQACAAKIKNKINRVRQRENGLLVLPVYKAIYTTKGDACVCVCVCVFAKLDQFLPVRSQFDSNQHVNSVRIATFQVH